MSDNSNWNSRQQGDTPQNNHPTGAQFRPDPQLGSSSDEFIDAQPNRSSEFENDLENDYPANNSDTQQAFGKNQNYASDDNPVMGKENTFDTFNDTDPNRYNNNAGLGTAGSDGAHEGNYSDERKELSEDDLDNSDQSGYNNTPRHPEF